MLQLIHPKNPYRLSRRTVLASGGALLLGGSAFAQSSSMSFPQWVASFKSRALARGISEQTYDRTMNGVKPDTAVYALDKAQPEFTEEIWQYLNRRVSDWRITRGKERAPEHDALFTRI